MILQLERKLLDCHRAFPTGFSFTQLCCFLSNDRPEPVTVAEFWMNEIEILIHSRKYGNARNNRIALTVLNKVRNLSVPFTDVNYAFLKDIEAVLLNRGLKTNSISVYFRALRAIFNIAINKTIIVPGIYPFRSFRIRNEKITPPILNIRELKTYFTLNLDINHPLYKTWLIGKLLFLMGGINFTDLIQLTESNINHDRIIYNRSKTKRLYSVILLDPVGEIINAIKQQGTSTLLGILSDFDLKSGQRLPYIILQKLKIVNKKLCKLGMELGFTTKLSTYTFRYSLANACKSLGYDIQLISELLGHSYGSVVTSGYVVSYEKNRIDSMMRKVCEEVYAVDFISLKRTIFND